MKPDRKIAIAIAIVIIFLAQVVLSQNSGINKEIFYPAGSEEQKYLTQKIEYGAVLSGSFENLKNNSYWVKSGTMKSKSGDVIVSFDRELTVNNIKPINQVEASYGYIVEIVKDKKENPVLYVWIASRNGERDSDDIIIEIN